MIPIRFLAVNWKVGVSWLKVRRVIGGVVLFNSPSKCSAYLLSCPSLSNDGLPVFVLNWSFRSSIFTAQLPGSIIQLLQVSTVSSFLCLLCQAVDVVLLVGLDVSLDLFVGFCINFLCPCLFRSDATVLYFTMAFFLLPNSIFFNVSAQ